MNNSSGTMVEDKVLSKLMSWATMEWIEEPQQLEEQCTCGISHMADNNAMCAYCSKQGSFKQ